MSGADFMKPKFVNKYLRMAHAICQDNNACFSRSIGCIIVDNNHKIRGAGYNGVPRGCPHPDSSDYHLYVISPQLTPEERKRWNEIGYLEKERKCPRKLLGYGSGERTELCSSCQHSECNAIASASDDLHDCHLFLWGATPCLNCAGMIIQAGIKFVYCSGFDEPYKHWESAKWQLTSAGIAIQLLSM